MFIFETTNIFYLILFILLLRNIQGNLLTENYDEEEEEEDDEIEESQLNLNPNLVGTVLFGDHGHVKKCFSSEDVALLSSRKEFENIIPMDKNKHLESDRSIEILIQYFYGANEIIEKMTSDDIKYFTLKAFYDAIGGYLNHYLVPVTKYSFYTGDVSLKTTKYVFDLFEHCKKYLNTNGKGWKEPIRKFTNFHYQIEPLNITIHKEDDDDEKTEQPPCVNLVMSDDTIDNDDDILIPIPKIETEQNGNIINIWLPFKRKHNFNPISSTSAFILMRYFVAVTKCYNFDGTSQNNFNKKFNKWLKENVILYLEEDLQFFPAFGGILRVLKTIKNNDEFDIVEETLNINTKKANRKESDEFVKINDQINHMTATEEEPNFFNKIFHPAKNINENSIINLNNRETEGKQRMIKFIIIIVTITFLVILIVALVMKVRRRKLKKKKEMEKNELKKRLKPSKDEAEEKKGGKTICNKLCSIFKRKKTETELNNLDEIELASDSAAVNGGTSMTSGSEISIKSKHRHKSTVCCLSCKGKSKKHHDNCRDKDVVLFDLNETKRKKRNKKRNDETLSNDGSMTSFSDHERKSKISATPKNVTLNIPLKTNEIKEEEPVPRRGIFRKALQSSKTKGLLESLCFK